MSEPSDLPIREPSDGAGSATQLSILLSAVVSVIDEEFRRSERLDAKSRNYVAVTGGFFAVVQAAVSGFLNNVLSESSFVPWIVILAAVAGTALFVAVVMSYRCWRLRDDEALAIETFTNEKFLDAARKGSPAVGVRLIEAYATVARSRRDSNRVRADALAAATRWCGLTMIFVGAELALAFVAVAVQ